MKKGIGLGIDDFRQIIKEDCYYFDKTNWIEELLKDRSQIKLFTRPRRFGKTLNMSTIKYFFDIKNAEENRKLFKDLYIEKSEYFKEQGQYPVIFISLKDLKKNTWEDAFFELKALLREVYEEHSYGELLPLIEVGASWEVCAFVSHIYLPSSSGSPYPDIFF